MSSSFPDSFREHSFSSAGAGAQDFVHARLHSITKLCTQPTPNEKDLLYF